MKTHIFWDFDGVLADSTTFVFQYWKEALADVGFEFQMEDYQKTFTEKFPFDYFHKNFPGVADEIYEAYSKHEAMHYPAQVLPFNGIIEGLKSLPQNYTHSVISANLEAVIKPWTQKHGLSGFFQDIVGRETTGYKDEKIISLIEKHTLNPNQCVFIGDTISDINHAQKAGIDSIGCTWGVHNLKQITDAKPTFICHNQDELFTHLKNASQ